MKIFLTKTCTCKENYIIVVSLQFEKFSTCNKALEQGSQGC